MNSFDFSIQDTLPRNASMNYVELRAGKGKAKWSKIYVNSVGFSYLDGLIWDKHREYGHSKKNKILSADWIRILQGFQFAKDRVKETNSAEELAKILKFGIMNPLHSLSDIELESTQLINLITELTVWIQKACQNEKYIIISHKN